MNVRTAWARFVGWIDPASKLLDDLKEQNEKVADVFEERTANAPEGRYFRILVDSIEQSGNFGQPVDFKQLAVELAKLEERTEKLEATLARLQRPPTI